jgi:hypothetical protein
VSDVSDASDVSDVSDVSAVSVCMRMRMRVDANMWVYVCGYGCA